MQYKEIKPCTSLAPYIHSFWELRGDENDEQWVRNFPDGCAGLVMNLGADCLTDNGAVSIEYGKTYAVGAMTCYKDSFIGADTHLLGVCLKPATFGNFYTYAPQYEFIDQTIEFERSDSFSIDGVLADPFRYLNHFFLERNNSDKSLLSVIEDIHSENGLLTIQQLAKRNHITIRQLERNFKRDVGIPPKEYSNIIRFQKALNLIKNLDVDQSLLDIAIRCGFYDHSHLTNEIKRKTGILPSQL
jgi:AraC-like DNA-binding protein